MVETGAGGGASRFEEWISHTDEAQQPCTERKSGGAQHGIAGQGRWHGDCKEPAPGRDASRWRYEGDREAGSTHHSERDQSKEPEAEQDTEGTQNGLHDQVGTHRD